MIDWTPHTQKSGTIDLTSAFDALVDGPNYYGNYAGANRFLDNFQKLTQITHTGIAALALTQALFIYDDQRYL